MISSINFFITKAKISIYKTWMWVRRKRDVLGGQQSVTAVCLREVGFGNCPIF